MNNEKMRYFILSIATLLVMLMVGCSSSATNSEPSVTVTAESVISESADEEANTTVVIAEENEQGATTAETAEESTESPSSLEETTASETVDETLSETEIETADSTTADIPEVTVAPSTEATSFELTAPTTPNEFPPRYQLSLDNVKPSYDTSYGSEIACTVFVLNYLGFNIDEATLASYIPSADSTSPVTYSEIKSAIANYFSDNEIQDYRAYAYSTFYYSIDMCYSGYPSVMWATKDMKPSSSIGTKTTDDGEEFTLLENMQCFVLIGIDADKMAVILYDPYTNSIVDYNCDDIEAVTTVISEQTNAFSIHSIVD